MKLKNYLNRLLVVLLIVGLFGCDKKPEEIIIDKEYQYIEPCNDRNLFSYLDNNTKEFLIKTNTGSPLDDNQLKMFNASLFDGKVEDIYGNIIDFNDYKDKQVVFEIVSIFCAHCKQQISNYNDSIFEGHPELKFIQFFAEGGPEEIEVFYRKCEKEINDNVIIIPQNDELFDYILNIGVNLTPSILCFDKGILSWPQVGITSSSAFNRAYDVAFKQGFDTTKLINENGKSIFEGLRSIEDVKNDLGEMKVERLLTFDDNEINNELVYSLIGQKVDYHNIKESSNKDLPSISFEGFEDKNVVLFYIYMTDIKNVDEDCLKLANKLAKAHPELTFVNIIVEEELSNYHKYLNSSVHLEKDTISSDSSLPYDFSKIKLTNYPAAIFIEKGTMVGACVDFDNLDYFDAALDLFVGDNSIAHIN